MCSIVMQTIVHSIPLVSSLSLHQGGVMMTTTHLPLLLLLLFLEDVLSFFFFRLLLSTGLIEKHGCVAGQLGETECVQKF